MEALSEDLQQQIMSKPEEDRVKFDDQFDDVPWPPLEAHPFPSTSTILDMFPSLQSSTGHHERDTLPNPQRDMNSHDRNATELGEHCTITGPLFVGSARTASKAFVQGRAAGSPATFTGSLVLQPDTSTQGIGRDGSGWNGWLNDPGHSAGTFYNHVCGLQATSALKVSTLPNGPSIPNDSQHINQCTDTSMAFQPVDPTPGHLLWASNDYSPRAHFELHPSVQLPIHGPAGPVGLRAGPSDVHASHYNYDARSSQSSPATLMPSSSKEMHGIFHAQVPLTLGSSGSSADVPQGSSQGREYRDVVGPRRRTRRGQAGGPHKEKKRAKRAPKPYEDDSLRCPLPECESFGILFSLAKDLQRHLETGKKHREINGIGKPYACPHCLRRYGRPDIANRHIRQKHPGCATI